MANATAKHPMRYALIHTARPGVEEGCGVNPFHLPRQGPPCYVPVERLIGMPDGIRVTCVMAAFEKKRATVAITAVRISNPYQYVMEEVPEDYAHLKDDHVGDAPSMR